MSRAASGTQVAQQHSEGDWDNPCTAGLRRASRQSPLQRTEATPGLTSPWAFHEPPSKPLPPSTVRSQPATSPQCPFSLQSTTARLHRITKASPARGPVVQQPFHRSVLPPPLPVLHHRLHKQGDDLAAVPRTQRGDERRPAPEAGVMTGSAGVARQSAGRAKAQHTAHSTRRAPHQENNAAHAAELTLPAQRCSRASGAAPFAAPAASLHSCRCEEGRAREGGRASQGELTGQVDCCIIAVQKAGVASRNQTDEQSLGRSLLDPRATNLCTHGRRSTTHHEQPKKPSTTARTLLDPLVHQGALGGEHLGRHLLALAELLLLHEYGVGAGVSARCLQLPLPAFLEPQACSAPACQPCTPAAAG